jgi:membrane protein required for colicin V production
LSYFPKHEKPIKAVIRHLPSNTPALDISDGLVSLGFDVIIGIYLCAGFAEWFRGYLEKWDWFPPQAVMMTSYILGFILIVGIIILAGQIVHRLVSVTPLSIFNHIVGGLLGLLMMVLFISLVFNVIEMFDHNAVILSQEVKVESRLYFHIKKIIPAVFPENIFVLKF